MSKWYPFVPLSCFAIGLMGYVTVARLMAPPQPPVTELGTEPGAEIVTVAAESAEVGAATPNHDPLRLCPVPPQADTVATIANAAPVATPNHGPRHLGPLPSTIVAVALPPESSPAAPPYAAPPHTAPSGAAPAFVSVDTTLYAKGNARLRAAPSTTADVMTKLAVNAPLHVIARSTDGAWWQVSLGGGRTGYVGRTAVSTNRIATSKPLAAAPVAAAAPSQPNPAQPNPSPPRQARRGDGVLGYVQEAMNWFTDTAADGTAPTAKRTER
jgi:hypothetical protein